MNEEIEKLKKEYGDYAKENGFNLNPNEKILEGVLNGLIARKDNFGEKYCPCRKMTGNKKEDKRIICPCIYHKEEIERDGHCFCNLFTR